MADKKISALTTASLPLNGTEVLPIVQSGTTKQVSVDNLTVGKTVTAANLALTNNGYVIPTVNTFNGGYPFNQYYKAAGPSNAPTASSGTMARQTWYGYDGSNYQTGVSFGFVHSSAWSVGSTPAYLSIQTNNGTSVTEKLKIGDVADVTLSIGNLIQGTAAKGFNFTANTPAAGMTSQLLNWYEEGTWTPTIKRDSTNPTLTYSAQVGRYTRIGRLVVITGYMTCSFSTQGSGNWYVPLPYTVANLANYTPSGSVGVCGLFSATGLYGVANQAYAFLVNAGVLITASASDASISFTISIEV